MKKLSLFVVLLFASTSMFANVNPVVKFNIDKGKFNKTKKSASKKNAVAINALKLHKALPPECPDEWTLIIDFDVTPTVELFPCDVEGYYREEISVDDLYFLYLKQYNSICMVEFDGLYASWVETIVWSGTECPDL